MRYRALAFDYDGTLAKDGRVDDSAVEALERAAQSGRTLLLVTGRELDDLERVAPRLDLFERVVAENGGLLYRPADRDSVPLADPPPERLVSWLRERDVSPLGVGAVMVATRQPHDVTVLEAIRELGLEQQLIDNKGAVMVLPPGVNKASGLEAALTELGLSRHNVVAVGDAENDHAFLDLCECSVAVANALPALKDRCDLVTEGARGTGVEQLIRLVIDGDLTQPPDLSDGPARHHVLLGRAARGEQPDTGAGRADTSDRAGEGGPGERGAGDEDRDEDRDEDEVRLPPYGVRMLVAGPSGSGKSTAAFALLERLVDAGYELCLVAPEGDYEEGIGDQSVVVGDTGAPHRCSRCSACWISPDRARW